ncbi:MAG: hypothetical protein K2J51_03285 [Alistipes sp.]|nr:hypothetical protein [Alistipes sp.]
MKRIVNPFRYVAGVESLAIGAAGAVATAGLSTLSGQSFDGILHVHFAGTTFLEALAWQAVMWLVFASLLWLAAAISSTSSVRAIDVYGTNLMARLPLAVLLALDFMPGMEWLREVTPATPVEEIAMHAMSPVMILYAVLSLAVVVWFLYWSYEAFAVSANLRGWRAVWQFASCYVAAECIVRFAVAVVA